MTSLLELTRFLIMFEGVIIDMSLINYQGLTIEKND